VADNKHQYPLLESEQVNSLCKIAEETYFNVVAKGSEQHARVLSSVYILLFEIGCLNAKVV
jgi:hypothetical protein